MKTYTLINLVNRVYVGGSAGESWLDVHALVWGDIDQDAPREVQDAVKAFLDELYEKGEATLITRERVFPEDDTDTVSVLIAYWDN